MRAVISDFGGVLTTPILDGFKAYEDESGITPRELGDAMARAAEQHGEIPLYELERGTITEAEFGRRLGEHLDGRFDQDRLRELYFERLEPNPAMVDFMAGLRARGLRMALLTNNVREWEPLWRAKLPALDDIFELVVDSGFVGMRKPEREIYELTIERLGDGIRAEECVFVDDFAVNCQAAAELGMATVRYEDAGQAIPAIEAALR